MNAFKLQGHAMKPGVVISKRQEPGIFKRKYMVCIRFDDIYNRLTMANKVEYQVNVNRYKDLIIGARVLANNNQVSEGFQSKGIFF